MKNSFLKLALLGAALCSCIALAEPNQGTVSAYKGFDADTMNGKVIRWRDARPQPTAAEWQAYANEMKGAERVKAVASSEEMVEALWRQVMENDSTLAEAIQAKRDAAKAK